MKDNTYAQLVRQYLRAQSRADRYRSDGQLDVADDYSDWARELMRHLQVVAQELDAA